MKSSLQTSAGLLTERLARHHADLTGSERALAEALQRDYPTRCWNRPRRWRRNGTSASTVVRFCRWAMPATQSNSARPAPKSPPCCKRRGSAPVTIGAERSLQQCVDDALLHDQHNLAATRDGLNLAAFEAMGHVPGARQRAGCMCWRRSTVHPWAHGWPCTEHVPPRRGNWALAPWTPPTNCCGCSPTMCCWSSASAATPVACESGAVLSRRGAQVLAITDSPAAPVATLAHHHLQVHTSNASPFDSYTAAFFLLPNALVSALAQLRHGAMPQVLARRDNLWDAV